MQWLVFSRLDPAAAKALCEALAAKLTAFLDDSGAETEWSCSTMSRVPKGTQRPEGTASIFKVDADPETDPVAATMLQLLLEQSDPLEVDWGSRQPAEEVIEMLADFECEPRLLGERAARSVSTEEEETLFERVLEAVVAASEDLERGMELKEAIGEASPQARAWMEHVVRNSNVRSDEQVDQALGLPAPMAERVHREIEAMLAELAG